jgi:hypothetical protein
MLASIVLKCIILVYEIPQSLESAMYSLRTACWKTTAIVAMLAAKG